MCRKNASASSKRIKPYGLKKKKGSNLCSQIFLGFGIFALVVGLVINLVWNDLLDYIIEQELILSTSSKSFNLWVENPIPMHIDFYFFNWTNSENLHQKGYKAELQELGPYRFREKTKKVEIIWNSNGTVTYKKKRFWYFDSKNSNGTLDDMLTTLNVIALAAARSTRFWNKLARLPLSATLSATQKISTTKKFREFFFEGFSDPLIDFARSIPGLSSQIPFDKFGWFYKRNGTWDFDGIFNMETGINGLNGYGKLRFWNYSNRTSYFEGSCGDVLGSAGDFWPPKRPKKKDIFMFSPDMCRSIGFKFTKEENLGNVKGYKYESGIYLFDNGTIDEKNRCFCGGKCPPVGSLNVSSCRHGAPAFVSYPHFYLGDNSYLSTVSGLKPNPEIHNMYIVLEKKWGIPLEVAIRLQINILLEKDPGIRMFSDVPEIFFPMIWFEQKVTMPENMRKQILFLSALPTFGWISSCVLYCLGSFFILIYIFTHPLFKKITSLII